VTDRELAVRTEILEAFARTGRPPRVDDAEPLASLAARHVVVLDEAGEEVVMAHPFAAPPAAAVVRAGDRSWFGSCAWDGLGIVAALGLRHAEMEANDFRVRIVDGRPIGAAMFHVLVPARQWWEDIGFT
jgi:hypothetical protein